jgi:mycothiol synthase
MFEYAAARKPILAMVAKDGAAADFMRTFGCGLVVPVGDADAIGRSIEQIYEHALNGVYARKELDFVNSEYGPSRVTAKLSAIFVLAHYSHHLLEMVLSETRVFPLGVLPPAYELRTYQPGDEFAWAALLKQCGMNEWNCERLMRQAKDRFFRGNALFFLALGPQIVATACGLYGDEWDGATAQVHLVGVHPAHQGRGLGDYMTRVVINKLTAEGFERIKLFTHCHRRTAIRLYLKMGFMPVMCAPEDRMIWDNLAMLLGGTAWPSV